MSGLRWIVLLLLLTAVFFSAVSVVYVTHYQRKLFVQLQALHNAQESMDVEWGKLQLEENTWSTSSRIEKVARKKLKMMIPETDEIIFIKVK